MKKSIAVMLMLALTAQVSYAQRHIKGQLALSPFVGLVDKVPDSGLQAGGQGLAGGLDLVHYTRRETYWKIGYMYDVKYYDQLDQRLTTDRHALSVDYAVASLHDKRRRFYISPLVGLHAGLERINNNQTDLLAGRILNKPTGIVGAQVGLEAEVFLLERTALVLGIQERYLPLPLSTVSEFRTYGMVGLRFSFFKN